MCRVDRFWTIGRSVLNVYTIIIDKNIEFLGEILPKFCFFLQGGKEIHIKIKDVIFKISVENFKLFLYFHQKFYANFFLQFSQLL